MSDHEMSEDEQEINVDTDSRLSHGSGASDDIEPRSNCSTPNTDRSSYNPHDHTTVPSAVQNVLPFSISNLLGKKFEQKPPSETSEPEQNNGSNTNSSNNSALSGIYPPFFNQRGGGGAGAGAAFLPGGYVYTSQGGVLRVPAHRPLGGGGPRSPPGATGVFNPWALGIDPVNFQRSAAAAAFASQVVKDRLSGKSYYLTI